MSNLLFDEFNPVTAKQWKQKIQFDLQGADYNNTLIWKTNEDISVKPFYHADDFEEFPNTSQSKASKWRICQTIYVANVEKSNTIAIKAIENGAESIKFIIPNNSVSIEDLIKNIDTASTEIHFEFQFLSEKYIKNAVVIPAKSGIHIHTDIIGNLAKSGNWFKNFKDDFNQFESIIKTANTFSVDVSLYQNAGANMVQQLAYALAHANEYLNHINNNPLLRVIFEENSTEKPEVIFNLSVGTNYFFEVAKLRALRILWQTLASEYGFNPNCYVYTTPTKRNKTLYDYNTNMLRTTTECMSAILGGSDTVCNLAYDTIFHKVNAFGTRIARNQLLILKYESYFNIVNNPADGAYYIETITNQLAEKSLELFKDIEANGGFLKQLKEGTIQRKIKESADNEQQQFDANNIVLVGTNKYLNKNDLMKDALELYPFVKTNPRKTLIQPIIEKRLSEHLEQKRLKNEA
ncbi:methylmalonyl-CoA mutase subunit beta [Flavobacteriaceae bacterium XHP0103]|uniref:methylmalonyl-CoA mutase subunit beta n=1 Tax=Marixanthotalea marina TaxID=2844359 RepID=UPI002989AB9B|nr:methylmalonyl-CoA mutase subunit beta [Marixanthotalea marina]MBU3822646.1 methylmalonyl-CoA mutase subunit beta [Marixanthotalea marina]